MAAKAGAAASFIFMLFLLNIACQAQLSPAFYDSSCPNALSAIRTAIRSAIAGDRRMAASLIRLHFHDCFVQGCDASILLDETSSIQSEKTALGNLNSARGYNVIEKAKTEVEKICPGVVSCADIIAVAARDASSYVGGPSYAVKLGRRDSTTASRTLANAELPAFFESLESLISRFQKKGLTARDMVALSGSHTLGQAQCFTFRERIYNDSNIDAGFASTRRRRCPRVGSDATLAPLDLVTPNSFDNNYFKNLMRNKGLLQSDQVLFNGGSTDSIVSEYSRNPARFKSDFGSAMIKMGDIGLLTGSAGQIRRTCSVVN
ncbi:PREDICTED: lignin-forming anionic peroxidase-like [Populus euphratica]|uniref:Peroxidase n=1 Tax=Populus euphratica TaxID=75702 RepID=A0AAJ6UPD7_POPEU|nr:PREDICTED: lignin-forming anionic peroxidase-like [Populus euphratica]